MPSSQTRLLLFLTFAFAVATIWSATSPRDRLTWWLEVLPAFVGYAVLAYTRSRFPFTSLVYILIFFHALILLVGGHYTYEHVPLFDWIRDAFHFSRNHFDRLGHFAQGFVPAMIAREVLLRRTPLKRGVWLFFLVTSVCLAISAAYELCEWRVSVATGSAGDAFLGTQGDPWDTQEDMATALVGAVVAQLTLAGVQDRQMRALGVAEGSGK